MKILITYYSYSGITDKAVEIFRQALSGKGEVTVQRLRPKRESDSFAGQCLAARLRKRRELEDGILFEADSYEIVILGLPIWAFAPPPAINTYLDKVSGLAGKKAIVLITSGSGAGLNICFKAVRGVLLNKGVVEIKEINIPNARMDEKDFIISSLQKAL